MDTPDLSEFEKELIYRWLPFYESLARGERAPTTPAQAHFVAVFRGQARAETEHEWAYLKYRRARLTGRQAASTTDAPEVPPGQHNYPSKMDAKFDMEWEDPDPRWR